MYITIQISHALNILISYSTINAHITTIFIQSEWTNNSH